MIQNYKSDTINVTATVRGEKYDDMPDTVSIELDGFTHILNKVTVPTSTTTGKNS